MRDWDPALYTRFEDERTRPARDLLARVQLAQGDLAVDLAVDLGCGPGNSTELLARRFPQATCLGLDSSAAMIASARRRLASSELGRHCRFEQADLVQWHPETAPDLIFANAVLQWVPGHEILLPHLLGLLRPGGVLALQMPDNREEPSHRLMRAIAADGPWAELLGDPEALRLKLPLPPQTCYDLMVPLADEIDLWRTTYAHPMDSPEAIVSWLQSTGLKPFVEPLPPEMQAAFLARYRDAVAEAYPAQADGKRLLFFPRFFLVARRKG